MRKILVVAESINVDDSSGSKANVALIQNLAKAGFELKVCHYTRKDIRLSGISCYALKENRRSLYFFLSRIERHLRNSLKIDIHNLLEKIFGFSFTLFNDRNSIVAGLKKNLDFEPDLVLTLSKGGSFRPHHALLQMPELHNYWMAYIHDPYPMHLYPRPYAWVEPGYLQKWKFIKAISQKARFAAFPSQLLKEWMTSYFRDFFYKGIVIPHQLEENPDEEEGLPSYLEPEKFNIVHAGNLLHARDPKGLIEGFKIFLQRNPEAKEHSELMFIGATEYFDEYLQEQSHENIAIKVVAENRPLTEVNRVQNNASVNVILEAKSEVSPFLPGKFPFCVSADKPILLLGPYYSECRRLLGENYEYWSEIDKDERIADHIESLYNEWEKEPRNLKLNRPDIKDYLSTTHLKNIFNKLQTKD